MLFADRNTGKLISKEEEANKIISDIAHGDTLVLSIFSNKSQQKFVNLKKNIKFNMIIIFYEIIFYN